MALKAAEVLFLRARGGSFDRATANEPLPWHSFSFYLGRGEEHGEAELVREALVKYLKRTTKPQLASWDFPR